MAAGLFGYLGYDMIRHVETLPDENQDKLDVHDSVLMRPSVVAIFDRPRTQLPYVIKLGLLTLKQPKAHGTQLIMNLI